MAVCCRGNNSTVIGNIPCTKDYEIKRDQRSESLIPIRMITKTAWKNIWRNRVRSMVVIASVAIGIFSGVFAIGVMEGVMKQRVDAALNGEISHIQVTHPDFRSNSDLNFYIDNTDRVVSDIKGIEGVESVASRLVIIGMANTASNSAGVQINGINPEDEKRVFNLYQEIYPGSGGYFNEDTREGSVYLGVDLAKSLNIIRYIVTDEGLESLATRKVPVSVIEKLKPFVDERFKNEKTFKRELKSILEPAEEAKYGYLIRESAQSFSDRARLTLTFLDSQNNQTGGRFRIVGLYDVSNSIYEGFQIFVREDELHKLTGIPGNVSHQVIVRVKDVDNTMEIAGKIKSLCPDLEVMTWQKIQPDLAMMSELTAIMYAFFMSIILAALAFGIVNTMLMVVLERTKELGMLTAIGMNKKKVFRMIMTESVLLSLTGGVVGMILSKILILVTARTGINLSSMQEGFEQMGFSPHIYPEIATKYFILVAIMIIITGILASVYPALKALRLDPADALRTE